MPVNDKIFDTAQYEKCEFFRQKRLPGWWWWQRTKFGTTSADALDFLPSSVIQDHFKIDNRPGQLGDRVKTVREPKRLAVSSSSVPISKRYLKYLTKKYLKKSKFPQEKTLRQTS